MKKGYVIRIYPNEAQRTLIAKTVGCKRWVWNKALELRMDHYDKTGKTLPANDLIKMLPGWKADNEWLKEPDSTALQQTIRDLDRAYDSFFENLKKSRRRGKKNPYGFPQFKCKHDSKKTYRSERVGDNIEVIDSFHVKLPKLGVVRARMSRLPEGEIVSATVKMEPTGKFFCSVLCEIDGAGPMPAPSHAVVGVDAGVNVLATPSHGEPCQNPRALQKHSRKLRREQRRLSRMEKGSANYLKQKRKVALVHEKIRNVRRDNIHKATTAIVRENQAVGAEDLSIASMVEAGEHAKNRRLHDAAMGEFLRALEYKCEWYGRDFVKVDPAFTSQTCPECGFASPGNRPDRDTFHCLNCGHTDDADHNAAVNIERETAYALSKGTVGHTGTRAA